jgi:hypothetical protein
MLEGAEVKKISEYLEHARHCRILAANAANREHRGMLSTTATTWESLAKDREMRLAREQPISDLAAGDDTSTSKDAAN